MARPKGSRDRYPRTDRVRGDPQLSMLTERDQDILSLVGLCKVLTTEQINLVFFQPKDVTDRNGTIVRSARTDPTRVSEHCRRRLRFLFDAGYLSRAEQPRTLGEGKPFVYRLTAKG